MHYYSYQFDRYPKTDFQGHLIHVCPILNLPIYFVKRRGVGGVRSNEEDRQLVIFFNTILFIHYLPKHHLWRWYTKCTKFYIFIFQR